MEDYEEEEHQSDSEEKRRQTPLCCHGTGVRLMSEWLGRVCDNREWAIWIA